jgi:hypothetical protein
MKCARMYVVFLVLASVCGCDAPVADGACNGPACNDAGINNGNGGGSAGQWLCSGIAFIPSAGTATCRFTDGRNQPIIAIDTEGRPVTEWDLGMLQAAADKYGWVFAAGACSVWCDQPIQECSDKTHARELPVCASNTCQVDGTCASQSSDAGVLQNDAAAKRDNGESCDNTTQCQSGYCVDGVCCNASCDGLCMACTNAKKGSGADGVCGSIAASTDPDNECAGTGTCGGTCNGNYTCQFPDSTVICSVGGSDGTCSGAGTCVPNTKFSDGTVCTSASQCQSGYCVDGVCCNSACGGLCQACNLSGSVGTCANIPLGQDPDNECAGALACNGSGGCTTSTSCTADSQCNDNDFCTVDACVSGLCSNTPKPCGSGLVCDPTNGNCVLPSQVNCYGLSVVDPGPDARNCVWWAKGSGNAISSFSPQDNVAVAAPSLACAATCYKADGSDVAPQMCSGKWRDGHQQDWSAPGGVLLVSGMGCPWDGKLRQ